MDRTDKGSFPLALSVRARLENDPSFSDWKSGGRVGSFWFAYRPVNIELNKHFKSNLDARYWVGRQGTDRPYVSFEFYPNQNQYPSLAAEMADDFRAFLLKHLPTIDEVLDRSTGNTIFRKPIPVGLPHEAEIEHALKLFHTIAPTIPAWTVNRLPAILLRELGSNPDPLDEIELCKDSLNGLSETERREVVKARIGQGVFRVKLLEYWKQCSVTNVGESKVLRASHIKRWCDSDNIERLDPFNGLLLTANLDALFDSGLISFSDEGRILISARMSVEDRDLLRIDGSQSLRHIDNRHKHYLAQHRSKHGFADM